MCASADTQNLKNAVTPMTHDTPENEAIAKANTVLRCQTGSRLHGVVVGDQDDSDEMGIVIEPPQYVVTPPDGDTTGFPWFRQYEHRTAGRGVRSGPEDECLISYSLRKWVGRAAQGDPSILLPLFAPDDQITEIAWPGHDLRNRRAMFLSKQIGDRYLRYLDKQTRCLKGEEPSFVHRPELIAVHGYDTKYAFTALRLAVQGDEMMRMHRLTLPIPEPDHGMLEMVRNGEIPLFTVLHEIDKARELLIISHARSTLPDRPDYGEISQWLQQTYRMWWDEHPPLIWKDEPCL